MSDVGLYFSPLDYLVIALAIGSPGLIVGAGLGALAWRRRRCWGATVGAVCGAAFCLVGVYLKLLLWS
jgi:hypothetical protein